MKRMTRCQHIITRMLPLQDYRCWWHGGTIGNGDLSNPALLPTIEHLLPKRHGGTGHAWNFVISCLACNRARKDRLDWKAHPSLVGTRRHTLLIAGQKEILYRALDLTRFERDKHERRISKTTHAKQGCSLRG